MHIAPSHRRHAHLTWNSSLTLVTNLLLGVRRRELLAGAHWNWCKERANCDSHGPESLTPNTGLGREQPTSEAGKTTGGLVREYPAHGTECASLDSCMSLADVLPADTSSSSLVSRVEAKVQIWGFSVM